MSDPFAPNTDPYAGLPGLSEMLGGIGGSGGGGSTGTGFDIEQLYGLQADSLRSDIAMKDKMGLAYDRMGAAPSKWATGAQTFGTIAQGLAGLGNIYFGLQGLKQQKKAFEFNKGVVNTNLNNSITDYNRRLHDTLTNRSLNNGQGQSYVSSQMAQWQAKRS